MILADQLLMIDAEAIVIDKPAGLPVDVPRDGGPSVSALADGLRFGFARTPVAAHRLDRDTSGCLLLARHPRALRRYQAAFAARQVEKTYLALVAGAPAGAEGRIALALAKRSRVASGWRMVVDAAGQEAVTDWRLVKRLGPVSLIKLRPLTGRTHQLRVHCASGLGCPIVGDPIYGSAHPAGMMLHAARLRLDRPGKDPVAVRAPLPARFAVWGAHDEDQ